MLARRNWPKVGKGTSRFTLCQSRLKTIILEDVFMAVTEWMQTIKVSCPCGNTFICQLLDSVHFMLIKSSVLRNISACPPYIFSAFAVKLLLYKSIISSRAVLSSIGNTLCGIIEKYFSACCA